MGKNDNKEFFAKYFVIYPFLFLIGLLDYLIGLILPYKYEDPDLPDKDAILTQLTDRNDPSSAYRSVLTPDLVRVENVDTNIYKEFDLSAKKYRDNKTMGVREVLSVDDEVQPNGKIFKKLSLGNYKWTTYENVHSRVNNFSNGLLSMGLKSNDKIVLFAETKPEWIISALSCFRIKVPVVTLYATLGVDALAFGINQTETKFVITSGEQLPKISKILSKIPTVTHLIVMADKFTEQSVHDMKKSSHENLKVYLIEEVEEIGRSADKQYEFDEANTNDLAAIMYTSGSTGNPKGVMISHGNILSSIRVLYERLGANKYFQDTYISYLPLAHVIEFCSELCFLIYGVRMGFSSPQTISDAASAIKKGEKGDLRELNPTIMCAVPMVLERLNKAVIDKISQTSSAKKQLFELAMKLKLKFLKSRRSTYLLDKILFSKISKAVLGQNIRVLACGGAYLSKEVHEFVQACLSPIVQAYGLTETSGCGSSLMLNQFKTQTVGSLLPCCELRLFDWPEGGYRNTDTPNPRGEIYIGGPTVAMGYFKMPEKTQEDFKVINGIQYFATGDIGEMLPNGDLRIIDRKKDLVKLSGGEYVSLNKVESVLKLLPFVDNSCVIVHTTKSYPVCLICPNQKYVVEYLNSQSVDSNDLKILNNLKESNEIVDELDLIFEKNPNLVEKFNKELIEFCLKKGLSRFEIPHKLKFVKETWLPDTGLVTDSFKLKRKEIEKFYHVEIEKLYALKI